MKTTTKEMCVLCGKTFASGPYARLCPKCLKSRQKEGGRRSALIASERKKQRKESE